MSTITRHELSRVGLRLLSEHGLADVSMRRVAKEFDVAVSALYWHVKDKQSLLGAMVDELLANVDFAPSTGEWRTDLATRAELIYDTILHTRDAAELTASVLALGTRWRQAARGTRRGLSQHRHHRCHHVVIDRSCHAASTAYPGSSARYRCRTDHDFNVPPDSSVVDLIVAVLR